MLKNRGAALAVGCACRGKHCSGGNWGISVAKDKNNFGAHIACCQTWLELSIKQKSSS